MTLWLLIAFASAGVGWLVGRDLGSVVAGFFGGLIVGGIGVAVVTFVAVETVHEERERELVAAGDRFSTESRGSFVFVVGSFSSNENFTYHYFFKHPDGGIEHAQARSGALLIYEDRSPGDAVLTERRPCKVSEPSWWHFGSRRSCDSYWEPHGLHVPPGSVTRDISFDLE